MEELLKKFKERLENLEGSEVGKDLSTRAAHKAQIGLLKEIIKETEGMITPPKTK